MRVLLTGATGMVSSEVVPELLGRGVDLTVLAIRRRPAL
jgi:uncharacterized protein YbjT (DUF2867 family)